MRLTVSEARAEIAEACNICETDSRVVNYLNKAVRRILPKGKWVGTYQKYAICTNEGCITWPRAIETIESMAICGYPVQVRNEWFEFLSNGPTQLSDTNMAGFTMVDRGEFCSFAEITAGATNRKIRVYADVAEDASARIILQGYDENSNWIRTQVAGNWIDGEKVLISTTPTLSTKKFSKLVRVIKPVTNGPVRLYEYNTDTSANVKALAYYEPSETLPSYRRSYSPIIGAVGGSGDCSKATVEVMAKLRFIPVISDNDFLLIGNLPALVEMARAVRKYENNLTGEGADHEKLALRYLQEELKSWLGDGPVVQLRVQNKHEFGAGTVMSAVNDQYYIW